MTFRTWDDVLREPDYEPMKQAFFNLGRELAHRHSQAVYAALQKDPHMPHCVKTPTEGHPLHNIAFHIKDGDEEYVGLDMDTLSSERDVVDGDVRAAFMEAFTAFHKKSDDLFRNMVRAQILQDPFPQEWVTVLES